MFFSRKLRLRKYPDKVLLKKAKPVEKIDDKIRGFVEELAFFIMSGKLWGNPTGLAAPQVGKSIRLFVALGKVFINPEIVWMTNAPKNPCREGCYSLEDNKMDYPVDRAQSIRVKYQDLESEWQEERFNGFEAQVIQHEMDHLDGILINSYSKK